LKPLPEREWLKIFFVIVSIYCRVRFLLEHNAKALKIIYPKPLRLKLMVLGLVKAFMEDMDPDPGGKNQFKSLQKKVLDFISTSAILTNLAK